MVGQNKDDLCELSRGGNELTRNELSSAHDRLVVVAERAELKPELIIVTSRAGSRA